jgi:SAM-dependent methyltransferase
LAFKLALVTPYADSTTDTEKMALPDVSRIDRIRDARLSAWLAGAGVDRAAIRRGAMPGDDLRTPLAPTRETLYSDAPDAVALRLLFCGVPVSVPEARETLGAGLFDALLDSGLLAAGAEDNVMAPFHLRTAAGLYLFSDYLGSHPDAVMGAGETTAVLYGAAKPRRRPNAVLDLGCGAGTLALLLARDAERVLGADINPRAVALARLNATVNGIANVEFRQGDLFAPVHGQRFDLIVSQPPYYPDPEGETSVFLHGGPRGDELAVRVMTGLGSHLSERGRALVFTSWPDGPPALDGMRVLELCTNRRELNGSRQSICVVEHGGGSDWCARLEVSAECWGDLTAGQIDSRIAARQLLELPASELLRAELRLPEGSRIHQEGMQMYLHCPLAGVTPLDETMLLTLTGARRTIEPLRAALSRGLLVPAGGVIQ